ncbi:ribonucleotide reductase, all-alpha domain protein [Mycobacterium kansasii]|uniref:Ribonucleoside-diphosphate reductase n=1 Tax=Mycobacterium kansasii TaxID=1768 RepID=A0A1V3WGW3_MYCKA|nr:ribonucleotide reductase, all-alpha domain protein [Mycobacterium kansasii]
MAARWPAQVRRRDATLVPFDIARIEAAVARAAREVAYDDPDMPATVARAVADTLGPRIASVERVGDFVEARLGEAGLDDVARAYIIYRQRRAELRAGKALLGVRDELKLSLAAVMVLRERYLLRDARGRPTESTGEMMDRTARCVAAAEDEYRTGSSAQWAERFATLLRNLEFLPNSPTLMNAGTDLGLLAGCFVLPVEDSLRSIFATLGQAAEVQRAGGGTGYTFSRVRPPGTGWPAPAARPAARCRSCASTTPPQMSSRWAVDAAAPAWRCSTRRTPIFATSSAPRPNQPVISPISTCRSASATRSCAPSNAAARTDWSTRVPARPSHGCRRPNCSTRSAKPRTPAATPDWCFSTRSIAPIRCRHAAGSRRPTRVARCRCCRTSPATSARSTWPG